MKNNVLYSVVPAKELLLIKIPPSTNMIFLLLITLLKGSNLTPLSSSIKRPRLQNLSKINLSISKHIDTEQRKLDGVELCMWKLEKKII